MNLLFVTNNPNKVKEIQALAGEDINISGLDSIGFTNDIPETKTTLEGNASEKAWYIYYIARKNCFADDTGLEIEALNGKPGVFSARYGGDEKSDRKNIEKVLSELQFQTNRKARFRTVISLIIDNNEKQFEGIVEGEIIKTPRGSNGFGYDPIFSPKGYDITFAEMDLYKKNLISHRCIAMKKLINYLKEL